MDPKIKQFYKDNSKEFVLAEQDKLRVKENIFSSLGTQVDPEPVSFGVKVLKGFKNIAMRGYVLAPLAVILFVAGTTYASADALPGEPLYIVKRQVESARLLIAPTEEAKLELQVNFAQKRLEEVEKINNSAVHIELQVNPDSSKNKDDRKQRTKTEEQKSEIEDESKNENKDRREKVREEANSALEFLNQTRKQLEQKGEKERAHQIEDKVKNFRENLENKIDREQNRDRGQMRNNWDNNRSQNRNWGR